MWEEAEGVCAGDNLEGIVGGGRVGHSEVAGMSMYVLAELASK